MVRELDRAVSKKEVSQAVKQLKKGKAGGVDEMIPEFVKKGVKVMRKEIES